MAENSKIEWTDHIDRQATGRRLGAYKIAARRTGCATVEEWFTRRESGHKWCFQCRSWKPVADFVIDRSRTGGLTSRCRSCTSHASRSSEYGLKKEELTAMLERADGKCPICQRQAELVIDHDHGSGVVRGLICDTCNRGLGMFADDPSVLARAIAHLRGELDG